MENRFRSLRRWHAVAVAGFACVAVTCWLAVEPVAADGPGFCVEPSTTVWCAAAPCGIGSRAYYKKVVVFVYPVHTSCVTGNEGEDYCTWAIVDCEKTMYYSLMGDCLSGQAPRGSDTYRCPHGVGVGC